MCIRDRVKNKTTNGIVWMEMDRFFRGYKSEILKSCEELIANHNKKAVSYTHLEAGGIKTISMNAGIM